MSHATRPQEGLTGQQILHYAIGEPLGSGGMGTVYRAHDTRLGRSVALKFVLPSRAADEEQKARILREARAASLLKSSGIASLYDIGEHAGSIFLVMELVEGEPLSARLERGPLPVNEAVEVALQVADALDEAHGHGIVHRDIKSANLMIDGRGRVKVMDFGLAKFLAPSLGGLRPDSIETIAGTMIGTFAYMAPEQALGRPVDTRADLFSLGVVLYEMLTGRRPFEGKNAAELLDQLLHRDPPAIGRFNYAVPATLEAITVKALTKDPQFRYQSARELYIDLHSVRRTLQSGSGAISSGAGDVSSSLVTRPADGQAPARRDRSVAVVSFVNITREPADEWIGSGIAETVTTDLNNVQGLTVVGRAQVFDALKQLGRGMQDAFDERLAIALGRQLRTSWIVGGGYQRLGDLIRITAQFIDVNTGTLVRTVKVDGRIDQIFELQDRIVYELSQGLSLTLGDTEKAIIEHEETRSVEAYEAYSRGLMNLRMATSESIDRAVALFERASTLDPEYGKAWAGLGMAYRLKGQFLNVPELVFKGIEALRRSVTICPEQGAAHAELGLAYVAVGHFDQGIEEINEAIRREPTNASAHAALGRAQWLGKGRLDAGIVELEHALALNPEAGYSHLQLSLLYALKGDLDRAESAGRRAVELQERFLSGTEGLQVVGAHLRLGYVYYRQGRYDDAMREYEREMVYIASSSHLLRERTFIEANQKLSAAAWRKGDREAADLYFSRALEAFKERLARGADDSATSYYMAALYALRGEAEQAARYLESSLREFRDLNIARAGLDPDFDPIRSAPVFLAVMQSPNAQGRPLRNV